jgi:NAD(P) transhydrogenase
MSVTSTYDLAVIGSGPAGQKAALTAARLKKRVVLIDRTESIGGVCIHTGTIPSKAFREAALELTSFQQRLITRTGRVAHFDITMEDLMDRARQVVRSEVDVVRQQMARAGVDVFYGLAHFTGPNTLVVGRKNDLIELSARNILIACGTEPARPKDIPFTPDRVIDSNELLKLKELPRSLIVVGGGVIGTEYACTMAAVGVKVTLIEGRPRLLEFIDDEIVESLQFRLRDLGVRLLLNERVAKIEVRDRDILATLESGKECAADKLLFSAGRQGATATLNLDAAGLKADDRGRLKVNEYYQTGVPHIYAAGDVVGFPALAATSMEQGRLSAAHMFREITEPPQKLFPYGVYTIPEVSMVGQTEQQLTAAKIPYEIGIARYRETARGQLISDSHGMLKLVFHPRSRRLLGVHTIGTNATELIHVGMAAMHAGLPIDYFVDAVFNYPTLAELYKVAANDGLARCKQNSGDSEPEADADQVAEIKAVAEATTASAKPAATSGAATPVAADASPLAINLANDADAVGTPGTGKLKAA